ncbi:MAG: high-potential iron-sulfur protein [Halofilum sp. (in: g-proteobacteria)]|nr:high-potential iron-sulfur protein [Halofilum sp. (in: g-proteobacteria)]
MPTRPVTSRPSRRVQTAAIASSGPVATAEWGGCNIFPGKVVARDGWCNAWAKQAG